MFDALREKLEAAFSRLRSRGKLSEAEELLDSCRLYRNMWDAHIYAKDVDGIEGDALA